MSPDWEYVIFGSCTTGGPPVPFGTLDVPFGTTSHGCTKWCINCPKWGIPAGRESGHDL
jgi:hypothetical protein